MNKTYFENLLYYPDRVHNNLGITHDHGESYNFGGELKFDADHDQYVYHPYGQDLTAEDMQAIIKLIATLTT